MKSAILIIIAMSITLVVFLSTSLAVDKSLVAYYNFDEGSGKEVKDLSGNSNDGAFTGDLKWVEGKYVQALAVEYPKVTDAQAVIVPDSDSLDISEEVTIMAWAMLSKLPTGGECPTVLTKRSGCGTGNYQLFWRSGPDGKMCYWGDGQDSCSTTCVITENTWHHVAETFDNKTIKFYMDGENCDEQNRATPLATNSSPLYIGTDTCNNCGYQGVITIDEVAIFNRVLSDEEIKMAMNEGLGDLGLGVEVADLGKLTTTWASIKIMFCGKD